MQGQLSCCAGIVSLFFLVYVTVVSLVGLRGPVEGPPRSLSAVVMSPEGEQVSDAGFVCLPPSCCGVFSQLPGITRGTQALRRDFRVLSCRSPVKNSYVTRAPYSACYLALPEALRHSDLRVLLAFTCRPGSVFELSPCSSLYMCGSPCEWIVGLIDMYFGTCCPVVPCPGQPAEFLVVCVPLFVMDCP